MFQVSWPLLLAALSVVVVAVLALDRWISSRPVTFYPKGTDLRCMVWQLSAKMLRNPGQRWKRLVRQEGCKLGDDLQVQAPFNTSSPHVAKFIQACELQHPGDHLPSLYPAAISIYPMCRLFANPSYPFPALGSVHASSLFKILRPMPKDLDYTGIVKIDPTLRPAKRGTLVSAISTLVGPDGQVYCSNTFTFLVLHKQMRPHQPSPKESSAEGLKPLATQTWGLKGDAGRQYAAVSFDGNMIHTSKRVAKVFGFPGTIIHGMYLLQRAVDACHGIVGARAKYPIEVKANFIRPVVIPGEVSFSAYKAVEAAAGAAKEEQGGEGYMFQVVVPSKGNKVAVEGTFRCAKA